MTPGTAPSISWGIVGFGPNRFNKPSASLFLNNSYCTLPDGVYFSGDFTAMAWIKVASGANKGTRLIEVGNGPNTDNVLVVYDRKPGVSVFNRGSSLFTGGVVSPNTIPVGEWFHLAVVLKNTTAEIYVNGSLTKSGASKTPANVVRKKTYIGRSNWHDDPLSMDPDAYAYFDEIMIYNMSLGINEINHNMNIS